ncbi:collagen-like protein [Pseudomonas sp. BN417]|uniref:collagen-like protein n=1 Tax=Pseudomonas sp. BN417 TaxID=2567890 RepID=UPI002458912B|nr:collagen-like protein [Pseudomonas sp. BN417]MDH4554252.1 collagen-like protein [Pseudomonas sp. BN417]
MRKLCLLAALIAPMALAEGQVKVDAHNLLKLPPRSGSLSLDQVEVADYATLLIPAGVTELRIGELRMGREARLGIAPSEQGFRLEVESGAIGTGSHITASGLSGSSSRPATPGRDISLRLVNVQVSEMTLDVRGGIGAPGYAGLDGADGDAAGCLWGQASRGWDGQPGGDGQTGGAGGQVRLEVPATFPVELLRVRLEGGAGGAPGEGGAGGHGGASKGCLLYQADGAKGGRAGQPGHAGAAGGTGSLKVVRF